VDYHSLDADNGPEYSTNDWPASLMRGETSQLRWATDDFFVNATANAIRYSTLYNFRFDADCGPEPADVAIGLFRPAAIGMPTGMSSMRPYWERRMSKPASRTMNGVQEWSRASRVRRAERSSDSA